MFDINHISGLSQAFVSERLNCEGYNELPQTKNRNLIHIVFEIVKEPMFLMLLACGTLYLFAGELQEAVMLLSFVFIVMGITIYQERKTERALEALRDLSSPRALVIREGQKIRIAGREVVREDILLLAEGDRVPADAVLLHCNHMTVDESLLTGESVPVRKAVGLSQNAPCSVAAQARNAHLGLLNSACSPSRALPDTFSDSPGGDEFLGRPGGDGLPMVYSGTLVVQGQGIAKVIKTGEHTEIGRIGKSLQILESEDTPLQQQTGRLVKLFAGIGVVLCVLVVLVFALTRGDWLNGFLAGLSLAMAMLPEEFPVVLTIFLALGAWRMSMHQVLTRRVPAIETIGSTTVLCVDKTGTLTMNAMTVRDLYSAGEFISVTSDMAILPEKFHRVVEYSILASPADPFDPMERAMKDFAVRMLTNTEHLHDDWLLQREYPLSREILAKSHVWRSLDGKDYIVAAKGAPEAIADLCHMPESAQVALRGNIDRLSNEGRRVIGVARARFNASKLPEGQHDFIFEFLGLLGLEDPVRPGVAEAVQECYGAGIRTIMITGDYPGTAQNIARQIALKNPEEFITGKELATMSDAILRERIRRVNIFARMVPEQKLRLVQVLQSNKEIVAMTGDGVNDAPALKVAHIGIAMGGRGTDVAREAASIVLLEDDFNSIVQAVKMGRRIYDNLKKAMAYIFSVHIPIAGLSLLPVILKWPLILYPIHIVFLELIIDPACSVVFEAEAAEKNVMNRPPRQVNEALLGKRAIIAGLIQGGLILAVSMSIYRWAMIDHGENAARVLAFIPLVLGNLALIFINRFYSGSFFGSLKTKNMSLWWVAGSTVFILGLIVGLPFFHSLFHFAPTALSDIVICIVATLVCAVVMFGMKFFSKKGVNL